jgi:hypothetical protein
VTGRGPLRQDSRCSNSRQETGGFSHPIVTACLHAAGPTLLSMITEYSRTYVTGIFRDHGSLGFDLPPAHL